MNKPYFQIEPPGVQDLQLIGTKHVAQFPKLYIQHNATCINSKNSIQHTKMPQRQDTAKLSDSKEEPQEMN